MLADVRAHEPADSVLLTGLRLLDERDVAPGIGAQLAGVVVGETEPCQAVLGDAVPFLAGHLAGLAADADAGVGEEPHPRGVRFPSRLRGGIDRTHARAPSSWSAGRPAMTR